MATAAPTARGYSCGTTQGAGWADTQVPQQQAHAKTLKKLKAFGLSLPGTTPKSPWPGHDDVAVNNKTFVYLSISDKDGGLRVSVKLPVTGKDVLRMPA